MKSLWLCQSDAKLLGPRLKGGNIRSDCAVTAARAGRITNQGALKGLEIEKCTSMNWEIGIDMYTLMCIKWMTNKNLLYKKRKYNSKKVHFQGCKT